jgi:hypothetical protein
MATGDTGWQGRGVHSLTVLHNAQAKQKMQACETLYRNASTLNLLTRLHNNYNNNHNKKNNNNNNKNNNNNNLVRWALPGFDC